MRNQPKYHFVKNTHYALSGLKDIIKTERSFKLEVAVFCFMMPVIFMLNTHSVNKLLLFVVLMMVLIAEVVNSAIERVVDLASPDYHEMAKKAKDAGSCIVFLSIINALVVWLVILWGAIFKANI